MIEEEEKVDTSINDKNQTFPTSIKSKLMIKLHLRQILKEMDNEFPLSELSEIIEYETKGKFNFLELKEIIEKKYPKLISEKKMFLLKYIPLTSIGVNQKSPYITLLNLFNFFEKILEKKIISASFILYKTAHFLKNKYRTTPSEFMFSIGLYTSNSINLKEFFTKIATKLNLDDIDCLLIFKGLDFKNCGKIKINDLILVLNSFTDEGSEKFKTLKEKQGKEEEKSAKIMKMFIDKNYINLDKFFDNGNANYVEYKDIKNNLMKEISNNQNNFETSEPITEKIVDDVLLSISRNYKIFKDDLENFLKSAKSDTIHNYIKLNDIQKFWIKQFISTLESINITPKMIFESSAQLNSPNLINLEDLKRQMHILLPGGKISIQELNNMMDALNINKNMALERPQYDQIIKQIKKEMDKEINKDKEINSENSSKEFYDENINEKTKSNWTIGIKSTSYHLLPVKGNYDILLSLNKDINNNTLLPEKNAVEGNEEENKINFTEEEKIEGDKVLLKDIIEYKPEMESKKELDIKGEYVDRKKLIDLLESFSHFKLVFPSYNLLQYLIKNEIPKGKSYEIIKFIDSDEDGYISFIQLINFILKELTHRSTKLLYKYLYLKIYQDLGFPSSEEFFTRYNFSIYDIININDLSKFYFVLNIELPLTMKSFEELRNIFKPPLIYKNICKLIDVYKKDEKMNNFGNINKNENNDNEYEIPLKNFDLQMKNLVNKFLDKKDLKKDDFTKSVNLHQKLKPIMKNCVDKMNLSQYNLFFSKPLNIEPKLSTIIFQLLKTIMPNGEQLLDKNDLLMFLESYSLTNDISPIEIKKSNDKIESMKNLIDYIENNYPPMKYAFEIIPFRRNGMISSTELLLYLETFYKNIPKNDLMQIVKYLDTNKFGFINYNQIQMFLYNFSDFFKYSVNIELKLIASNLIKKGILNANEYLMKDKFKDLIKNYGKIGKKEHGILFNELCSSNDNKKNLYNYIVNITGTKKYDIKIISDIIDGYLEFDYVKKIKQEKIIDEINLIEGALPKKEVFEKVLQNINLGDNGYVFLNTILRQIPKANQKIISDKFDKEKIGFISFPEFITICRDIYGTNINLNYKLCAQYIYKCFIKEPENIQSFLLNKINETNILIYLTYDVLYNNFMFGFVNDKFLFDDFYNTYKEKKGEHMNMLKLHSLQQFILYNNPELKSYPKIDFIQANKDEINSQDYDSINNLVNKKLTTIREIIETINYNECDLKKDFSISEKYMRNILNKYFDYINEDIDIFCNYFHIDNNNISNSYNNNIARFNLQKLFCFDKEIKNHLNIIITEEVLPKIKEQIINCGINNYRQYKLKNFKSDFLTINEAYEIFNSLYNSSLFHCLCIINEDKFLSIEKFFDEFELKDLFQEKEYEPILKTAIIKLNNYFEEHKDKLKLFKEIDLDKNGFLSVEEFMTLLNSLDDLNLEDNQKLKLLKVADKNKDGKINSKEFLTFIKSAKYLSDKNSINEMKSTFPQINKKIAIEKTNFIPRFLEDKSLVEKNLEINQTIYKELNGFLNTIIILQKDIVENFFNFDCIEQDFTIADSEQSGKVSYSRFNSILKKRLFRLKDSNFMRMINFANEGLEKNENVIRELNENKVIDYKNFLTNLVNYNEQGKNKRDWEEDEINIIPKEQKEEEKAQDVEEIKEEGEEKEKEDNNEEEINTEERKDNEEEIKLGGELIKEEQVEKNEENEFDNFMNNAIGENKEETEIKELKENEEKESEVKELKENEEEEKESEVKELKENEENKENNNEIKETEEKELKESEINQNEEKEINEIGINENDMIETNRVNEVNVEKEKEENEFLKEKSQENEINKERELEEKKSEETKEIVNDENEILEENNNTGIKLGNNLIEENRIEKE